MSKQVRIKFSLLALVIFVLVGLSIPASTSSQPGQQATTTASSRNAALIAATAEVLKETSEVRQLPVLRQVPSSTQSRAEIERMLVKNLDEETTPAQLHATEVTLKKLGLAPASFRYRELMLRLLTEQVAGYYDPKMREFHLADWIDLDGQKPVMAHELTHALQDQHFDLRRFSHWPRGDSDAELAAHALIEGDATLLMSFYVLRDPLRALAFLRSMGSTGMSSDELDKAPRALRESLLFPYQQGLLWTRRLYGEGGWARISKAYTELPQSSEQILHPEKYFAKEAPVKLTLPDLTPLLNRRGRQAGVRSQGSGVSGISGQLAVSSEQSQPASADRLSAGRRRLLTAHRSLPTPTAHRSLRTVAWRRIDTDVNGEWSLYLILDQFIKSPTESRRAAAGWGGDRSAVYEGPKVEVLFVCLSTWDTEDDARDFFDAYVKRTGLRYPETSTPTTRPSTLSRTFHTAEGDVIIELRGARVLIVEGSPDKINSKVIAKSLWQER